MYNIKKIVKNVCLITIIILVTLGIILLNRRLFEVEKEYSKNPEILGYSISFNLNGADKIDKKNVSCILQNDKCYVTLPNAERKNGEVLGYSSNPDDQVPEYLLGTTLAINENKKLYVISRKKNTVYIEKNGVDYLETDTLHCFSYNSDNKCKVVMPVFNKEGYENRGYSTSLNSLVGFVFPNEDYLISKDVTVYPIYGVNNRTKNLDVAFSYSNLDSMIEVEEGCPLDIADNYLAYLQEIKEKAPYLLIGNKISFVSDESFDTIWGGNYVGMNYGPRNLRAVDIRCGTKLFNDYYGTMVHEMSHTWDFYYATKIGNNITSESDMINLFNKYKKMENRPFRDYSYSSIYEFLADLMKYYYFKYLVPNDLYSEIDFPDDMKKTIEKYICISQSEYDKTKCSK